MSHRPDTAGDTAGSEAGDTARNAAGDAAGSEADPAWAEAERHILAQLQQLDRWAAERWAAAHERQLPRVSILALRASCMQAAIDNDKGSYLEAAYERIAATVAGLAWAAEPSGDPARQEAIDEIVLAVTETAQHALTTVVLAEEAAARRLPDQRRRQLALAGQRLTIPPPPAARN